MTKQPTPITCPVDGKLFTPWRGQRYCCERCRKQAENWRLRGDKSARASETAEVQKHEKIPQQNQQDIGQEKPLRGSTEGPAFKVRNAEWIACNEITRKLSYRDAALGWVVRVEGRGWFGRVNDDRGEFSVGPCHSAHRAERLVEALIKHEPFDKQDGENSWRGTCWEMLSGEAVFIARNNTTSMYINKLRATGMSMQAIATRLKLPVKAIGALSRSNTPQ
jgi:hypothetical protein